MGPKELKFPEESHAGWGKGKAIAWHQQEEVFDAEEMTSQGSDSSPDQLEGQPGAQTGGYLDHDLLAMCPSAFF